MAQIVRLGGPSKAPEKVAASPEAVRRNLLIGALVTVITLALAVIVYVNLLQTGAVAVRSTGTEVAEDSAVFEPKAAREQQQLRQAEQEKEDSAVFGQAPSAAAYQTRAR